MTNIRPEKKVAVVIHPRQPYIEWINILDEDHNVCLSDVPSSVFIVQRKKLSSDTKSIIRRHYKLMFEKQLQNWWEYSNDWPQKRDLKLFHLWFDLEVIEDVCDIQ